MISVIVGGIITLVVSVYILWFWKKTTLAKLPNPALNSLSHPARALVNEYNALPADSRPFPDIMSIVKGLDAKYALDAVERRRHFDDNWLPNIRVQNGPVSFTWKPVRRSCGHHQYGCKFSEYVDLHRAIQDVRASLDEKERKLLEQANAPSTDMLKELTNALRQEADIQRTITRDHL